jgi:hypothetical protein
MLIHPFRCKVFNFISTLLQILGSTFTSDRAIKAVYIDILMGFAWLDMGNMDLMLGCTLHQSGAN